MASATRPTARMYAAARMCVWYLRMVSYTSLKARFITLSSRPFTSFSSQK